MGRGGEAHASGRRQLFDYFGIALELDGDDTLLIGSEGDDEMAVSGGAAYVYRYDADPPQWSLEQKLMAADIESPTSSAARSG